MAIARDASSPATYTMATAGAGGDDPTGTSASFTPPLNSVITVCFAVDTNAGSTPTPSISNTGFVVNSGAGWTLKEARGDAEGTGGYVAVYRGVVTSSAAGTVTTTATNTGVSRISQVYGSAYVDVWTDADTDQSTAVDNEGSFTTNTFTSTLLATGRAGSQVVTIYGDWNASGTPTTGQQGTGFTGSFYSGIRTYQTTPGAAGNVAAAFDGPGTGAVDVNWVAVEILAAVAGGQTISVGQASETDSVLALTKAKRLAAGLTTETDSVLALVGGVNVAVGLVSETDSAFSIARSKVRALGLIASTETALAMAAVRNYVVGLVSETASVFSITRLKAKLLGLVSESDEAQDTTADGGTADSSLYLDRPFSFNWWT